MIDSTHISIYWSKSSLSSKFLTPSLMYISFFSFFPNPSLKTPLTMSSSLLTQLKPSICTVVFSPFALRPRMVGASTMGMLFMGSLLQRINRDTRTAVSVANCIAPKCLISTKCCLRGAGRSLGGWSPSTPPNTMQFHCSPGESSFWPRMSSMHTFPSSCDAISCRLSLRSWYLSLSQAKHCSSSARNFWFSSS